MKYSTLALTGIVMAFVPTVSCQGVVASGASEANQYSASAVSGKGVPGLLERNPRYQVRRGDSFDLDFSLTPEFNQTVAVQPDGYVTLKGAGSVFVEGQTVPELTKTLKVAYGKILHDPIITVALRDFEKPYFIAAGQVGRPGKYDLRGPITVTEGVAIAGGFTEKSKHSQVVLFHPTPDGVFEAKLLNIKKLLASRNLSEDVYLQPGDMLYVPQNAYSKIERFIPSANMGAYLTPTTF
jgi:polysaccharide biosynthesis/export protein